MKNLISKEIFDLGVAIGHDAAKLTVKNARRNSFLNLQRALAFANQIRSLKSLNENPLSVLNLSGINTGETDIFTKALLESSDYTISNWTAYDSPRNEFVHSTVVKDAL